MLTIELSSTLVTYQLTVNQLQHCEVMYITNSLWSDKPTSKSTFLRVQNAYIMFRTNSPRREKLQIRMIFYEYKACPILEEVVQCGSSMSAKKTLEPAVGRCHVQVLGQGQVMLEQDAQRVSVHPLVQHRRVEKAHRSPELSKLRAAWVTVNIIIIIYSFTLT